MSSYFIVRREFRLASQILLEPLELFKRERESKSSRYRFERFDLESCIHKQVKCVARWRLYFLNRIDHQFIYTRSRFGQLHSLQLSQWLSGSFAGGYKFTGFAKSFKEHPQTHTSSDTWGELAIDHRFFPLLLHQLLVRYRQGNSDNQLSAITYKSNKWSKRFTAAAAATKTDDFLRLKKRTQTLATSTTRSLPSLLLLERNLWMQHYQIAANKKLTLFNLLLLVKGCSREISIQSFELTLLWEAKVARAMSIAS